MTAPASLLVGVTSMVGLAVSAAALAVQAGVIEGGSWCTTGALMDCHGVLRDPHGAVLGIPAAALACGYFIVRLALLPARLQAVPALAGATALLSGAAVAAALALLGFMVLGLGRLCWMCLAIDACLAIQAVLAWRAWRAKPPAEPGRALVAAAAMALAIVPAGWLIARMADGVRDQRDRAAALALLDSTTPTAGSGVAITCFIDYACPACLSGLVALKEAARSAAVPVAIEFVNCPLEAACNPRVKGSPHPGSCRLAKLALAAEEAGALASFQASRIAGETPADGASTQQDGALDADISRATAAGITTLPTYLVGPYRIQGSRSATFFTAFIAGYSTRRAGSVAQ